MQNSEYFIWGAGLYGERLINYMKNDITFKAVIDNNPAKQGLEFHGLPIVSYNDIRSELPDVKIVIAINIPTKVRAFLLSVGLKEYSDFFTIHDFYPRYFWKKNKSLVIKSLDVPVTTLCTMSCEGCAVFLPMAVSHRHLSYDDVISNINLVYNHIDKSIILNFAVGENLLNDELPDICSYVNKNHSGRYQYLTVQTNGTIVPGNEAMARFASSGATFGIANYPENAEYTKLIVDKCNEYKVNWYYNSLGGDRADWIDYGDPRIIVETDPQKLREKYQECWKPGMAVYDGRLFICSEQAWSILVAEQGTVEPGDAFDLHTPRTERSREELYKYVSRQPPEKGYITHCMRCNCATTPLSSKK